MGKRNPRAKWTLPSTINPVNQKCFRVSVPDDPYYIAAFRGAILNLCSASQWQDDPDHKAREVANVWRDVYANISDCGGGLIPVACPFDFRFGDTHNWLPIVAGGITYANYTGAGWHAGYTGQHGGSELYYQLQIYHTIPSAVIYSYTIEYTCLQPVTVNVSPGFETQGPYPPGTPATIVVAANGASTDTLRLIMTTSPQSVSGSDIVVTKVIVNIANSDGSCH